MKKLIGMSLMALFAMSAENTANAQVDSGYSTIVKNKGNGKQKVKVVPNPPVTIYTTPEPEVIQMFQEVPFYGYRRHKYYDDQGRKVIIYDNRVPYSTHYYHYYYR